MNKKLQLLICMLLLFSAFAENIFSQGLNHNFLLGSFNVLDTNVSSTKAILSFTNNTITVSPASFPMKFDGAQANISDENGNLLMATNGCEIMDASGNVMQNGNGLTP